MNITYYHRMEPGFSGKVRFKEERFFLEMEDEYWYLKRNKLYAQLNISIDNLSQDEIENVIDTLIYHCAAMGVELFDVIYVHEKDSSILMSDMNRWNSVRGGI